MTDDELQADIERMLTIRRNRKALGFYYYETHRGAPAPAVYKRRANKSRAGQINWRHRPFKPAYVASELDILEQTLRLAHATLDMRGAA